MAIEHSNRISAIASVSGTKGNNMTATPVGNISVLQIHGTNDQVVSYETGNATLTGVPVLGTVNTPFGIGAEENVEYWRSFNNCATTPIVYDYPTNIDNRTYKRYVYPNGDNSSRVAFIKVENGTHSWYASESLQGIHYFNEIIQFFRNQWETSTSNQFLEKNSKESIAIFPNPVKTELFIESRVKNQESRFEIYDISGKLQLVTTCYNLLQPYHNLVTTINVADLPSGTYFLKIADVVKKFVKE
jgi:hypothetical protein